MRHVPVIVLTMALAAAPALAGPPGGKPATAGPKTPKAPKASPKMTAKATPAGRAAGPAAGVPKAPKSPKTTPSSAAASKTRPPQAGGSKTATTTTSVTPTTSVSPPPAMPKNPKLVARLQAMLPPGMTVEQAAVGFKNQGQFIAAVQVSNNLGIAFADLKTSMVTDGLSLGQSIQQWKPTLDGETEAVRATRWAEQQLEPR